MATQFYDPRPLLQAKDLDGETPRIAIVDGNRTSGKTTGHLGELYRDWVNGKGQFACGYKWTGDISGASESIFSYITSYCDPETGEHLFPDISFDAIPVGKGALYELYATKPGEDELEICGYCFSLNGSSKVRKYRSLLANVNTILYDDFLPEDGKYCPNELDKFQSIYLTVAGANRPSPTELRSVRVILTSNHTEISNPYYMAMGITKRFQDDCKWIRGHGWVWHRDDNKAAMQAIQQDKFLQIFGDYGSYAAGDGYLVDTAGGVERLKGRMKYMGTIKVNKGLLMTAGIQYHYDTGYLYISASVDPSCKAIIAPPGQAYEDDVQSAKVRTKLLVLLLDAEASGKIRYETLEQKALLYMLLNKKLGG